MMLYYAFIAQVAGHGLDGVLGCSLGYLLQQWSRLGWSAAFSYFLSWPRSTMSWAEEVGVKSIKASVNLGQIHREYQCLSLGVKGRARATIPNPSRLHGLAKALHFFQELHRVCVRFFCLLILLFLSWDTLWNKLNQRLYVIKNAPSRQQQKFSAAITGNFGVEWEFILKR